jgi:elongation factor Ts
MLSITTADIKHLRKITGAGVLDCKKALQETDGDVDKAVEFLRKKGLAAASKKATREANEGLVSAQVSADGKIAVMVEVNCETDFVARTEDFKSFVVSLVRQVTEQPDLDSVEVLLAAPYIDNENLTVAERLTDIIAKLGENMLVRQVARFELDGEGLLDSYIHFGGRVGVLVEVAGGNGDNGQFANLVHDIALQVAATSPHYVEENKIPAEIIEAEKNIYQAQLSDNKKPDNIKKRIIEGKLKKWYSEVVLLNQVFVKESKITIGELLKQHSKELDNDIKIRRFARFELGVN